MLWKPIAWDVNVEDTLLSFSYVSIAATRNQHKIRVGLVDSWTRGIIAGCTVVVIHHGILTTTKITKALEIGDQRTLVWEGCNLAVVGNDP